MTDNKTTQNKYNPERRKFLKILLVGTGAFFLGKFFDPFFRFLGIFKSREVLIKTPGPEGNLEVSKPKAEGEFGNWKVTEKEDVLTVQDQSGEEILILDLGDKGR